MRVQVNTAGEVGYSSQSLPIPVGSAKRYEILRRPDNRAASSAGSIPGTFNRLLPLIGQFVGIKLLILRKYQTTYKE